MRAERSDGTLRFFHIDHIGKVQLRIPFFDRFAGIRKDIHRVTKFAIEKTGQHLMLHELTLTIKNNPDGVIPGYGHLGWAHSANELTITVNPKFHDREQLLYKEIPRSVSHELHHAVRFHALPKEPRSLGASLITEGLAVQFETQVWGGAPSPWANTLTEDKIQGFLAAVIAEQNSIQYDHKRWFFGKGDLPNWTGYAIGAYLVGEYLKIHPNETPTSLVATPPRVILNELAKTILKPR